MRGWGMCRGKYRQLGLRSLVIPLAVFLTAIELTSPRQAVADAIFPTKAPPIPYVGSSAYNWNGFYAGGHMGVAWGQSNWTAGPGISGSTNLFQPIDTFDEAGSFFARPARWLQLRAAKPYSPRRRSRCIISGLSDAAGGRKSLRPLHWRHLELYLADARCRQLCRDGVVFRHRARPHRLRSGHWLFYATGGFAWTYNQQSLTQVSTGNSVTPFLWRLGWTAGAGVEVPIAPHWTARLEYLFTDYGKTNTTFFGTQPINPTSSSMRCASA